MERGLILFVAMVIGCLAPGVHGTQHLTFANSTPVDITRTGCGTTKLCVETPDDCDPAGSSACLFASLMATAPMPPNGTDLMVELRGESEGYIALGLTANPTQGITLVFVCTRNTTSNPAFFSTRQRNNSLSDGVLTPVETIVRDIRGRVSGNMIRCEFTIPRVNASNTREDTTFNILLGTGNATGGVIGPFTVILDSGPLNVTNPAANNATSGAPQPHATVLVLLSALILTAMLRT